MELKFTSKIAPTPSQEMREGGEIWEVEDQESHGERQHRRSSNLRRERNLETHRADELSPPRLLPRRRRGPSRHVGEDVHNFKFSKLWLEFFTKKLCLVAGKTMEKKKTIAAAMAGLRKSGAWRWVWEERDLEKKWFRAGGFTE